MKNIYGNCVKRLVDIAFTVPVTLLVAPLMILVAIGIKFTTRGPVIFIQPRLGKNGRTFNLLKFRTMYVEHRSSYTANEAKRLSASGVLLKLKDDPRVTPIGRILRRTSIDELPQLFNVLAGNMSLVGPRPLVHLMVKNQDPTQNCRFSILPGITGYWQVYGRENNSSLADMLIYDLLYIKEISFWNDLKVLALTIPAVLSGRGAF